MASRAALAVLMLVLAGAASAEKAATTTGPGGRLESWRLCHPDCTAPRGTAGLDVEWLNSAVFSPDRGPAQPLDWRWLTLQADSWRFTLTAPMAGEVRIPLRTEGGAFDALEAGTELLQIDAGGVRSLDLDALPEGCVDCRWAWQQRLWLILLDAPQSRIEQAGDERWVAISVKPDAPLSGYAGPVGPEGLSKLGIDSNAVEFAGLWVWLRWLAIAFQWLLGQILTFIPFMGIAIMLTSLAVKILMAPLTAVAERWHRQVNEVRNRLDPEIRRIKRAYRGEEQVERIAQAHRAEGVTMFYTFKSFGGFLIQIPVFLAAYYALKADVSLLGREFLWIDDLSSPDAFAVLPFEFPFFGNTLNLLPFVMMAATLLSSWFHRAVELSEDLGRRQRRQLYLMAIVFFLLLYTMPAGMVLYWTTNNLLQLARDLIARALPSAVRHV